MTEDEKTRSNFFKAENFMNYDMSPLGSSVSKYGLERYQAERIAKIANKRLSTSVLLCDLCQGAIAHDEAKTFKK